MIILDEEYSYEDVKEFYDERKHRSTEVASGVKLVEKEEFEIDGDSIIIQNFRGMSYFGYRESKSGDFVKEKRIYKNGSLVKLEIEGTDHFDGKRAYKEERYYINDSSDDKLNREDYIERLTDREHDTDANYISITSLDSKYCPAWPALTRENSVLNQLVRPLVNNNNNVIGKISLKTNRKGRTDENISIDMHTYINDDMIEGSYNRVEENYIDGMGIEKTKISTKKNAESTRERLYTLEELDEKDGILRGIEKDILDKTLNKDIRMVDIKETEGYALDLLLHQDISLDID